MKPFLVSLLLLVATAPLSAANHLRVAYGSLSVFGQTTERASIVYNYDGLCIEDQPLDDYCSRQEPGYAAILQQELRRGEKAFVGKWKKKARKALPITAQEGGSYLISLHITNLDLGNTGAAMWGMSKYNGGAVISGVLEVADARSGQLLCRIEIDQLQGLGNDGIFTFYREAARVEKVFQQLASKLNEKINQQYDENT